MAEYSKEYCDSRRWSYGFADFSIKDELINLRYKQPWKLPRERDLFCEGFGITRIRVDEEGAYFVMVDGRWDRWETFLESRKPEATND